MPASLASPPLALLLAARVKPPAGPAPPTLASPPPRAPPPAGSGVLPGGMVVWVVCTRACSVSWGSPSCRPRLSTCCRNLAETYSCRRGARRSLVRDNHGSLSSLGAGAGKQCCPLTSSRSRGAPWRPAGTPTSSALASCMAHDPTCASHEGGRKQHGGRKVHSGQGC